MEIFGLVMDENSTTEIFWVLAFFCLTKVEKDGKLNLFHYPFTGIVRDLLSVTEDN